MRVVERGAVVASDGTEFPIAAQTICIHGDAPGALQLAAAVATALRAAGVTLQALSG